MKLVSWNVNGLRSIYQKGLLDFLHQESPDILCLQETKVLGDQLSPEQHHPQDYELLLNPAARKGYSGVGVLSRPPWQHPVEIRTGLGEEMFDREGRYLITDYGSFLLYTIYFPSGTTGDERQGFKYQFLEHLYDHLASLDISTRSRMVIVGDFNICHREIDIHHPVEATRRALSGFLPEERAWMDRFVSLGFTDTFRLVHGDQLGQYSWWSFRANSRQKNLGWRIDYCFVSDSMRPLVKGATIHKTVTGSDHCPVSVELDV